MLRCPSCLADIFRDYNEISGHFIDMEEKSDADHIMWLNRYISKERISALELSSRIEDFFRTDSLKRWIIERMVKTFFSEKPHPFILAMQSPGKYTLAGYAFEHHHFLKQWVRSCSQIVANTDIEDIQHFEIGNIISEWQGMGDDMPSHHELLLRMGESYGYKRSDIYETEPLQATQKATEFWNAVCRNCSSVEGMAAMHSLELIANRNMKKYGASIGYFDPVILSDGSITKEAVAFLKEGYEADISHSETALDLIEKYSMDPDTKHNCLAIANLSFAKFSDYLDARLERGEMLENKQH